MGSGGFRAQVDAWNKETPWEVGLNGERSHWRTGIKPPKLVEFWKERHDDLTVLCLRQTVFIRPFLLTLDVRGIGNYFPEPFFLWIQQELLVRFYSHVRD
jgi:hypothetical protein